MDDAELVDVGTLDRQPMLEGDLLRLRPLTDGDFDDLWAVASDPLIWEQHPAKERSQPEGFRAWFQAALASEGALVVIDRSTGAVIGTSRYDGLDPERGEVEIGWTFLARSHWGGTHNGELKHLMLEHALVTLDAVVFRVHHLNHRSQRAVEKLGARLVGTEPFPSGPGENVVFRLDRHSFQARPSSAGSS